MAFVHEGLAGGRWHEMSLMEQLANVGSEVGRALRWHEKHNDAAFQKALERALELFSLTVSDPKNSGARLREVLRMREVFLDYIFGGNTHMSTAQSINRYFLAFGAAVNMAKRRSE
jgi:hypothetical protein